MNKNVRNGVKVKKLRSSYGEIHIEIPQDRNSEFKPQIVGKYKKDIRYRTKNNKYVCKRAKCTKIYTDVK